MGRPGSGTARGAGAPGFAPSALAEAGPGAGADAFPHIVAWNLTRRCNLACAHCYISAGDWHTGAGELDTRACLDVLDQVLELNPSPVLILSGGEPLLRADLETLAERAASGGATVVVGTNGVRLTTERIRSLMDAGVTGVAVSIDSLDPAYHDRFRTAFGGRAGGAPSPGAGGGGEGSAGDAATRAPDRVGGSSPSSGPSLPVVGASDATPAAGHGAAPLRATLDAVERCRDEGLDFVVQTTLTRGNRAELPELVAWAADRGAVSFNLYFLVATGRGKGMSGLTPEENDEVLRELVELEARYRGRMMVRSKCQPQLMRHVVESSPDSPLLNYRTRCPCGVHYVRITPEGKVTPCPYSPVVAGDLTTTGFREIWETSEVFRRLRSGELGGKCGRCEYREVCGGCRARALAETGDLMGPDESCAYEPTGREPVVEPRGTTYGTPAEAGAGLPWTPDARARLERIPSFVRGVVTNRVEAFARERGYDRVDREVMAEVRRSLPVDFSKRLPFFLRDGADA